MRDILTVFRFTLRDGARKKAFWVTTIIVLVLIVGICCIPRVMELFSGGSTPEPGTETPGSSTGEPVEKTETCYLIDEQQLIPGAAEALAAALPQADVIAGEESQLDSYKTEAEEDNSIYIVQVLPSEQGMLPKVQFYVHDILSGAPTDTVTAVLKTTYVSQALQSAGVSADMAALALSDMTYDMAIVGKMDMSGYVLGILLTMLTFFAVYYYGYGVAMSVASEKTSRVMETLVVSAKPSRILVGKILGMGVLGLLQMLMFLVVGALGYTLLVPEGFTIGGMPLALSAFTPASAVLILVYFLLGYALYGAQLGLRRHGQPHRGPQRRDDAHCVHQPDRVLCCLYGDVYPQRGGQADRHLYPVHLPVPAALPAAQRNGAGDGYRHLACAAGGLHRARGAAVHPDLFRFGAALRPAAEAEGHSQAEQIMPKGSRTEPAPFWRLTAEKKSFLIRGDRP